MKFQIKSHLQFVIDPQLISSDYSELLLRICEDEKIYFHKNIEILDDNFSGIFFVEKANVKKINRFKNKILVFSTEDEVELQSVVKINLKSFDEILYFLKKTNFADRYFEIQDRLKISEKVFEDAKNTIEKKLTADINEFHLNLYEQVTNLELFLLQEELLDKWNEHFKNFLKLHPSLLDLAIVSTEELFSDDYFIDENTLIYKIDVENYFLFIKFKNYNSHSDSFILELILSTCLRTLQILDTKLVKSDGEVEFWKKIFSKIPYPMAVISSLGDLLSYNEHFAKVGILPKECLRFKDFENAEILQNLYRVRRIDFPINLIDTSLFIFYASSEEQKTSEKASSIDELGIISSSIAHELNNPLAGILAALSLLSLEDNWSVEALADLDDMKSGAKRCKELVEIFLGFSKFSPLASSKLSIRDSLDQSINLLRFRMIESNLRLDMKYSPTLEKFSHRVNASIMSMIFYLICGELMTSYAHHRLVTQTNNGVLSGEVIEFSNQVIIKLDELFEYEEKISQAKLIQHLILFEKLEVSFLKQEIRLIYRN